MKKRILFIPDLSYLSNPVFLAITKAKTSFFHTIYLNPNFPFGKFDLNTNYSGNEIKNAFDQFEEINQTYFDLFKQFLFRKGIHLKFISFFGFLPIFSKYNTSFVNALDRLSPECIVMSSDMSCVNLIVNNWANKKKIPVVIIQSAFLEIEKPTLSQKIKKLVFYSLMNVVFRLPFETKQFQYGHECESNYLFLWGSYFNKDFKSKIKNNKIRIIGNPAFDILINNNSQPSKELVDLADGRPVIAIFTQPLEGFLSSLNVEEIEQAYKKLILNNQNWFFIIKIHPRETEEKYRFLLQNMDTMNFIITRDMNLNDIYSVSKVHISIFSFSSFEAVIANIPVILFRKDLVSFFDNFNNEIELRANNIEELESCIALSMNSLYLNKFEIKRKEYLESRLNLIDGKSSERVLLEIEKILKN